MNRIRFNTNEMREKVYVIEKLIQIFSYKSSRTLVLELCRI